MNLILAVIMTNFTRISQIDAEQQLKLKEKELKKDKRKKTLYDDTTSSEEDEVEPLFPSPEY